MVPPPGGRVAEVQTAVCCDCPNLLSPGLGPFPERSRWLVSCCLQGRRYGRSRHGQSAPGPHLCPVSEGPGLGSRRPGVQPSPQPPGISQGGHACREWGSSLSTAGPPSHFLLSPRSPFFPLSARGGQWLCVGRRQGELMASPPHSWATVAAPWGWAPPPQGFGEPCPSPVPERGQRSQVPHSCLIPGLLGQ